MAEGIGAWDPNTDPDPEPGQPPRNVVRMGGPQPQHEQPPGERTSERDHGGPPAGTATIQSYQGNAMPVRNYPKRCMWLRLPAPYDAFYVYAWVNVPDQLINDLSDKVRGVRSPDAPSVDPDDPAIDPYAFELDVDEYGINDVERQARIAESERRLREQKRRKAERAKRQQAFDAATAATARLMGEIVMEHNIPDLDGNLLAADDPRFWEFAGGELQGVIMGAVNGQRGKLNPTSGRR